MIPVDQTLLVEQHGHGDCLRACVASILELPLTQVPDFRLFGEMYFDALALFVDVEYDSLPGSFTGVWMAFGRSPRGGQHAVVYDGARMVHDPHPSRAGLLEVTLEVKILRLRPGAGVSPRPKEST